jgi:DnaK suppressor protein
MAAKKKAAQPKAKSGASAKGKVAARKTAAKAGAVKKATATKAAAKRPEATTAPAGKKVTAGKKAAATKKKVATTRAATRSAASKRAVSKTARPAVSVGPVEGIEPYKVRKGEQYMNENHVEHFRKILLAWKKELMEEVDRTVHHMQDEAANFPDPNDRATQESEFSMELRTRDRERKLIKKIDEAILNLENDEYGYCESCGVEIGVRRLEARPTATLCIDCKTLDEIREKQMGG